MPSDPTSIREAAVARATDLINSLPLPEHCSLVATGSLARGEMTGFSDLDLILLHPDSVEVTSAELEALWYPIWDAKYRLDHAVRTPEDCAGILGEESTAALAVLEMRHLWGDPALTHRTRDLARRRWRSEIQGNFDDLVATSAARWRRAGSVVNMTHPDIKHGRGGLRDIDLLRALALANLCDATALTEERLLLLNVRTLLHEQAHRLRDILDPEFAEDIAGELGMPDRYALAAEIADAARNIDRAVTAGMATARGSLSNHAARRGARAPRRPLDLDVVDYGGQITLSRKPDMEDPFLLLRVAAAAARTGLPVNEYTWRRLADLPELPEIWSASAADDFFALLSSPEHSADVINVLDQHGLWDQLVPEWAHIRGLLPRERTHIHTIDAHSLVTVSYCAAATVTVARPDLLLLGALYHDIGKGYGRPHAEVGAELVTAMAKRLGLNLSDLSRVQTLVAEHTSIARLVAVADPYSDKTRDQLLDALHYDQVTVDLLEVLTEADAKATGPGVWNHRLEAGLRVLASRSRRALTELVPDRPVVEAPSEIGLRMNQERQSLTIWWSGKQQTDVVGVLAVIFAKAWNIIDAKLAVAEDGTLHLELDARPGVETLREAADAVSFTQSYYSGVYSKLPKVKPGPTAVSWNANVLEVRTIDRPAALGTLLAVLPEVSWLSMRTPGATMIVQAAFEGTVDRDQVDKDVTRALATS
ncbi:[protein-PII] uridylyltransferase [Corynebacterium alimapuense]|uniref:[protein-PII] uridylyltransferase n=1 Tax=Corynebacterium alimapuense TaxID=1576874 RepID=A0A3M8KA74_9CORY|nr:[protein-PII] uridylyltransferase [Corynebacterium alimapuense]RNE49432.1 [protein-PII] uridylyltransferase [Corynebacterium alimapuense]